MTDWRSSRARRSGLSGRRAETVALVWLMLRGYRPLARRYGGKGGEIDLIVRRGGTVAFVEVKQRLAMDDALVSISPAKHALVTRRVRGWLARNPWAMRLDLRIDAVFVAPWRWPRHCEAVAELVL